MCRNFLISLPEIKDRTEGDGHCRMEDIVIYPENEECDLSIRKDYDASGMYLWFEFHDGIAFECAEDKSAEKQLVLLYPTMKKCLETPGMKVKVENNVGEAAGIEGINFHDIALTFGKACFREDLEALSGEPDTLIMLNLKSKKLCLTGVQQLTSLQEKQKI